MKITASTIVLTGFLSISHASPNPNNGGGTLSVSHSTVTTSPTIITSAPPTGATPPIAYPSSVPPNYSCYPIIIPSSAPHSVSVTSGRAGTVIQTVTLSVSAPPVPVTSVAHENWGTGTLSSIGSVTTVTSPVGPCPPGYTTSYDGGNTTTVTAPTGGSSSAPPVPAGTTTSTSNVVTSSAPSSQNLNAAGDKPTGAAASSFKFSMAGTLIGGIAAASWLV